VLRRASDCLWVSFFKTIDEAMHTPFIASGSQFWCQVHTRAIGRNMRNRGGADRVSRDWFEMVKTFRTLHDATIALPIR
jgi:hypothetical protein